MDFIITNWKILLIAVLIVIDIILTIVFKKTKTTDNVLTFIMSIIPGLINKVEVPGNGENKLLAVITFCLSMLKDKFGMTDEQAQAYVPVIRNFIEKILSTPQKKGN